MARSLRIEYPGAFYHITSRGIARQLIFFDEEDKSFLLFILKDVMKRYNWLCHSYCLMNNHYHLVVETLEGNLSSGMRRLNSTYTQRFNKRHQRVGHLFQGRYKGILIDKENYFLEVIRYVVLNPVRAGLVSHPKDFEWSSYGEISGINERKEKITTEYILLQFHDNILTAKKLYKQYILNGIGKEDLWKNLKGRIFLGNEDFVNKIKEYMASKERIKEIPKVQRYYGRPSLNEICKDIKNKLIRNKNIYEAHVRYGYNQKEIADFLGIHYSYVSKILKCYID